MIATSNAAGQALGLTNYSPHGEFGTAADGAILLTAPPTGSPFGYTGRQWDAKAGLYQYRARYYLSEAGMFLSMDPIGTKDDPNLYGYVANGPVNGTDPSGNAGQEPSWLNRTLSSAKATLFGETAQQVHDRAGTGEEMSQAIWDDGVRDRAGEAVIGGTAVLSAAVALPVASAVLAEAGTSGSAAAITGSSGGARASQVHSILDPIAQARRTTAVVETASGRQFVASSRSTLSPAQRAALRSSETAARGQGHAEVTAVRAAQQAGETPVSVAASRSVCPACEILLRAWRVRF